MFDIWNILFTEWYLSLYIFRIIVYDEMVLESLDKFKRYFDENDSLRYMRINGYDPEVFKNIKSENYLNMYYNDVMEGDIK